MSKKICRNYNKNIPRLRERVLSSGTWSLSTDVALVVVLPWLLGIGVGVVVVPRWAIGEVETSRCYWCGDRCWCFLSAVVTLRSRGGPGMGCRRGNETTMGGDLALVK